MRMLDTLVSVVKSISIGTHCSVIRRSVKRLHIKDQYHIFSCFKESRTALVRHKKTCELLEHERPVSYFQLFRPRKGSFHKKMDQDIWKPNSNTCSTISGCLPGI